MREAEAKSAIEKAGGRWDDFMEWMSGQTMGMNEDGSADYYEYDVDRFIRNHCNPNTTVYD